MGRTHLFGMLVGSYALTRASKPPRITRWVDENNYGLTTSLFELAHVNPPTHRLLFEATPIVQRLASEFDQSCRLTVYGQGKQVVLCKVDTPSGMGFAVCAGAEIDVIVSASGRVLLASQDDETRRLRIEECLQRRPDQDDPQIDSILENVRVAGFESIPRLQVRGLWAVSFPILDTQGRAIAALTVPYAEHNDPVQRKSIPAVTKRCASRRGPCRRLSAAGCRRTAWTRTSGRAC